MLKLVVVFGLKEGVNPDQFWKYYLETKAPNFAEPFKESDGLLRYVINRVVPKRHREDKTVSKFAGITEIVFKDEQAFANRHVTPESKRDAKWLVERISPHVGFWVEEHIIVGNSGLIGSPKTEKPAFDKGLVLFGLKEGVDQDVFWKWYLAEKAQHFSTTPGVVRYVLNRITKVDKVDSSAPNLTGLVEFQFATLEAVQKRHSYEGLGETKEDIRYSMDVTDAHVGLAVEEHIIVGEAGLLSRL